MRQFSILSITSIAALSAWTFVASCGFNTLAQCQAMSSGRGGDCLRDPSLGDMRSAYAFAPKHGQAKGTLGTNR
jgi:hypothetical protein